MRRGWTIVVAVAVAAGAGSCGDAVTTTSPGDPDAAAPEYEANALVLANGSHGPELCVGAILTSDPPQCGGPPIPNWRWDDVPWREEKLDTTMASVWVRGTYDGEVFRLTAPPARPRPELDVPSKRRDFSPACDEPEVIDRSQGVTEWEETGQAGGGIPEEVAVWVTQDDGEVEGFVANVVVRPGSGDEARRLVRAGYLGPLCVVERDQPTRAELSAVQAEVTEELRGQLLTASSDNIRGVVEVTVIAVTEDLRDRVARRFGARVVLDGRLRPVSEAPTPD